jgi:hypothetical protein
MYTSKVQVGAGIKVVVNAGIDVDKAVAESNDEVVRAVILAYLMKDI